MRERQLKSSINFFTSLQKNKMNTTQSIKKITQVGKFAEQKCL
jgi:hypothetical protein